MALLSVGLIAASAPSAASSLTIGGTGADLGTMKLLANAFTRDRAGVRIRVLPSLGSGGGIRAVIAGKIDLAIASRPVKNKERAKGARSSVYARTALAIATSERNPMNDITSAEMVAMYAGEQTAWPDGSRVRLVLRPKSDSDTRILIDGVPAMKAALAAAHARRGVPVEFTDQDAASAIEHSRWGVGTAALSVILAEDRPLKALALDGVRPSPETIADGRYPLIKTMYFVVPEKPSELVREFIAFVRSEPGREILARTGHSTVANHRR